VSDEGELNGGDLGCSESVLGDKESLCAFITLQIFFMLKKQHYTLKKVENVKKHNRNL